MAPRKSTEDAAVANQKITAEEREVFDGHNDPSATKEIGCTCLTCKKVWASL